MSSLKNAITPYPKLRLIPLIGVACLSRSCLARSLIIRIPAGLYSANSPIGFDGNCPCCGGNGGASSLVLSAIILCIPIPTPSMTANNTAQPIAEFLAALNPPRTASEPPVKNPAMIALYLHSNRSAIQLCKSLRSLDIRIFLLPDSLHCAVICGKHAAPYAKVSP